jgi:hypothetical protein
MAITTSDELLNAMGNNTSRIVIDKSSIANLAAGQYASLWRATGTPGQGPLPGTTSAIPTNTTTGALGFANQSAPTLSYLAWMFAASGNSAMTVEVHDRLAHMSGLSLNSTTQQNITGLDLQTLGLPSARRGDPNYSDVQWWLECYTDGGSTASTATVNVTYDDSTTGALTGFAVGGTLRAGRLIPLIPQVPAAQQGRYIRGVNSVTLSAGTGITGNFGFTATRPRTVIDIALANKTEVRDWAQLGLPEIPNDSCLMLVMLTSTTSTGVLRGGGKIVHG